METHPSPGDGIHKQHEAELKDGELGDDVKWDCLQVRCVSSLQQLVSFLRVSEQQEDSLPELASWQRLEGHVCKVAPQHRLWYLLEDGRQSQTDSHQNRLQQS